MTSELSDEEMGRRAPVWAALSNLFLDTDIALLYQYIAKELAASSYTDEELLRMLRTEAGPTFATNMFSIAGEWVGWTAEETRELIGSYLRLPATLRWFRRLATRGFVEHAIASDWPQIRALRDTELNR